MKKKQFRVHIDKERCKGCLLCVSVCLKKILKLSKGLNSRGEHYSEIVDQDACVGCQYCAQICPDAAIEIDKVVPAEVQPEGQPEPAVAAASKEDG